MKPLEEAVHDGAGQQLQIADPAQYGRIEELGIGAVDARPLSDSHLGIRLQARRGYRHGLEKLIDQFSGGHTFGFGVEVGENPMPENRVGESSDVFEAHVVTPLRDRPSLPSQNEILGGPDTRSEGDPLVDEVRTLSVWTRECGPNEAEVLAHLLVWLG